jgi:hypothetical protein
MVRVARAIRLRGVFVRVRIGAAAHAEAGARVSRAKPPVRIYNGVRPQAAPEVVLPTFAAWPEALRRPASTAQVVAPRPTLN